MSGSTAAGKYNMFHRENLLKIILLPITMNHRGRIVKKEIIS
jgi:hypothetical protein